MLKDGTKYQRLLFAASTMAVVLSSVMFALKEVRNEPIGQALGESLGWGFLSGGLLAGGLWIGDLFETRIFGRMPPVAQRILAGFLVLTYVVWVFRRHL